MKKVLFVATVTRHINAFHIPYLKMFKEKGYEVHVASCGEDSIEYCDKHFNLCFERSPFNMRNYNAYKELKKIINENNYEIIHCHTPVGGVLTRLAAKKSRKKGTRVIYTAHGFHFYKGAPILNWILFYPLEKFLARYTDTLITINSEDYDRAKQKFKSCKDIQLVHGVGVDKNKFDIKVSEEDITRLRKELDMDKEDFVFVSVGELNKNKNQIMQIEAMRRVILEKPNCKLLIVGKGSLDGYLKEKVKEYSMQDNVKFAGFRKDIPQVLHISNCLLATSYREGLPVNVMEAMMCDLPIIVTNTRGQRELALADNIVELGDVEGLARKMIEFVNSNTCEVQYDLSEIEVGRVREKMEKIYGIDDSPKRVLQIIRTMNIGGAETFIMNLYRNIDRKRIQFDFLVSGVGKYDDEIKELGGNIYYLPYITDVGQFKYVRLLKKFFNNHPEYKIVHSHIDQVSGIILETAKKSGVTKTIAHSHNTKNSNGIIGKMYKKYLQSKINRNSDVKLSCGVDAAKWLYKRENKNAIIINNGIDVNNFLFSKKNRIEIRKELNIPDDVIVVGHVGRFSKQKNHSFLIKIFNEFQKQQKAMMVLVGTGELENDIRKQVKELELEDKVLFLGGRKDTNKIYSAFDLLLFPSLYEGLSVVLVEAQCNGLKILASSTIDKKTNITGNIHYCGLNQDVLSWVNNMNSIEIKRNDTLALVQNAGYDIKNVTKIMQNIYQIQ